MIWFLIISLLFVSFKGNTTEIEKIEYVSYSNQLVLLVPKT